MERFKITPRIGTGSIELTSPNTSLSKYSEILINNPNTAKTEIWLDVQDTKTGKVYETNRVTVWNRSGYKTYIRQLNKNISNWPINAKMYE